MGSGEVIPGWVYGFEEYEQMFDLTEADLAKSILDFPGSVSSFNADAKAKGRSLTSGDAIYNLSPDEMQVFAEKLFEKNVEYLKMHSHMLQHPDEMLETVTQMWRDNMSRFLADYAQGKTEQRYQSVVMPNLPYDNHQFQLALCSDYVFKRFKQNDCGPAEVVSELCRVAEEVRIFPLLNETGDISPMLGPLMLQLQENNHGLEVRQVPFQVLKGGNAMLRIWATECVVES